MVVCIEWFVLVVCIGCPLCPQADEWKKKHEELQETVRYAHASPYDPRVTLFIETGIFYSYANVYVSRIVDHSRPFRLTCLCLL